MYNRKFDISDTLTDSIYIIYFHKLATFPLKMLFLKDWNACNAWKMPWASFGIFHDKGKMLGNCSVLLEKTRRILISQKSKLSDFITKLSSCKYIVDFFFNACWDYELFFELLSLQIVSVSLGQFPNCRWPDSRMLSSFQ